MENVLHTVAPLLPSLVHSSSPARPTYLPPEARSQPQHGVIWSARDKPTSGRDVGRREAVEKSPHPPHQYCSLTWWKLTLASIFHRVIGREDRMPWLDMPTLLPVQMMTHRLLHYSWLLQRRGRRWEKSVESNWRSRARWSTSRSRSGSDRSVSVSSRWVKQAGENGHLSAPKQEIQWWTKVQFDLNPFLHVLWQTVHGD